MRLGSITYAPPGEIAAEWRVQQSKLGFPEDDPASFPEIAEAALKGINTQALGFLYAYRDWLASAEKSRDLPYGRRNEISLFAEEDGRGNMSIHWGPDLQLFETNPNNLRDWFFLNTRRLGSGGSSCTTLYQIPDFRTFRHMLSDDDRSNQHRFLDLLHGFTLKAMLRSAEQAAREVRNAVRWENTLNFAFSKGDRYEPGNLLLSIDLIDRAEIERQEHESSLLTALEQLGTDEVTFLKAYTSLPPDQRNVRRLSAAIRALTGTGGETRTGRALEALGALGRLPGAGKQAENAATYT